MNNQSLAAILKREIDRIDSANTTKRNEKIIDGFSGDPSPKAIIKGRKYVIFNSNDYLGLRFSPILKQGEHEASSRFGTGPGAVRFISGTLKIYRNLEKALAKFHQREDAMVFSSAFAANLAVIHCLIKGQSKNSLLSDNTLVISDSLNHRSIIDGIRVAGLPKEQKLIYNHLDYNHLGKLLENNRGKFIRVLIVTDGVFSMLGEYINLDKIKKIVSQYQNDYKEGITIVVDDSHGVAAFGRKGLGIENFSREKADVLIGTMGKGFGADGGYVVADKIIIDYLRESAATYIYSNSISPGVAGAALSSVKLLGSKSGLKLLTKLEENIRFFKKLAQKQGLEFAADSIHPIQPILIGDPLKTKKLTSDLFNQGILITSINYPVVPPGRDEIRVQINAGHTKKDIEHFVQILSLSIKKID